MKKSFPSAPPSCGISRLTIPLLRRTVRGSGGDVGGDVVAGEAVEGVAAGGGGSGAAIAAAPPYRSLRPSVVVATA
jgi:hypothetical protein